MAKVPKLTKPHQIGKAVDTAIAHASARAMETARKSAAAGAPPSGAAVRHLGGAAVALWLVAAGCTPLVPDSPPKPIAKAVLVCADSDHELFEELKAKFSRFDVSKIAETPECTRGRSAASEVGHTCFEDEASCSTPRFIDGKAVDTPTSAYDVVLLFPQLLYGSLSAKQVTTSRTVTAEGASNVLGPQSSRRPTGRGTTITEHQTISSSETDYTGEVFVFEPRPGVLHPGKRFKNIAAEPLRDLLLELLRATAR